MKMVLAICARDQRGATREDRAQAVDDGVSRALQFAQWAFPAQGVPEPIIRRFEETALITWSNEPAEWDFAGGGPGARCAVDGVGYLAPGYLASEAADTHDLLSYSASLGGCFNLFRATDRRIEAVTDATKSNSVYVSHNDRLWVLSSRALLGHMVATNRTRPEFDLHSLAAMPARGFILGDTSPYSGTTLLGVAEHVVRTPEEEARFRNVPDAQPHDPRDWSEIVDATAEALISAFDPLDGGDLHLALTGGRDARVIAAALTHHKNITVDTHTMGTPAEPHVALAAEIASVCGWSHQVTPPTLAAETGDAFHVEDPLDRITRVLDVHDAMNSAWDDIQGYGPVNVTPIMSDVGGEILRGGLILPAHSELSKDIAKRELTALVRTSPLVADRFTGDYGRNYIELAETAPYRASDDFAYHERIGRWVASRRMGARFRRRVIDPLLDNRFIRATRRIDPETRWTERLAFDVIARLSPNLRDLRLEGSRWRFESERPHPEHVEGWEARSALMRNQRATFHWKNLADPKARRSIDSLILDSLEYGPAAELLSRRQVERFLSEGPTRAAQRWHLATTATLLAEQWWHTGRESIQNTIRLQPPANPETHMTAAASNATPAPDSTPAVSVIVPMHNAERHIGETLASIADQTLINFEVIVVDDGSTDRSAAIVDEFCARDARFSRMTGPAIGSAGAARNVGMTKARGEYVAFLDADDLFAPSMLEKMFVKARSESADVILTGFKSFDDTTGEETSQKWGMRVEHLPKRTPFAPTMIADHIFYVTNPANWNKLFRREFVEDHKITFQHLARSNDAYFTFLSLAKASRISYVEEELVKYRIGNAGSLQGSIHKTPLEFVDVLTQLDQSLREAGIQERFHRAFVNLVATMSTGALARANTADAFVATYDAVRDRLFPRFGITEADPSVFLSDYVRRQIKDIIEKPAAGWLFDRNRVSDSRNSVATDVNELETSATPVHDLSVPESQPDVSVIIPVFNSARWLHECLLSVLGQSEVSLEVICVNDGSTDDSLRILNEYATSDPRVLVVTRPNGGLSASRNTGLELASGRYTVFLDSDDYWKSDDLSALVAKADTNSLDVLLFDAESFFEPGVTEANFNAYATYYERKRSYSSPVTGIEMIVSLRRAKEYRPSACLYLTKTQLLKTAELRFIRGIAHEDNPFTFALLLNATRVAHVNQAFYARRVRPGSIMTAGSAERSMRGYFACYLDMNRRAASFPVRSEWREDIGRLVHDMYSATRKHFVDLPADAGDRIQDVDPGSDAYSSYLSLRRDRDQVSQLRKLSK